MSPDCLVVAIQQKTSLWENGSGTIKGYVDQIPSTFLGMIPKYVETVNAKCGSMTKLTLMWLKEDHLEHYSIIINTPGGYEWLDAQVAEILTGLGINA